MIDTLAIDWGSKRTGIALGDATSFLALPYTDPAPTPQLFDILNELTKDKGIKTIVVGYPTGLTRKKTEVTKKVDIFISKLQDKFPNIRIVTLNERATTQAASNMLRNEFDSLNYKPSKDNINHAAALALLQRYFNHEEAL